MTVTIISRHSKTIHKLVEEQMKKEAQELGFDPWGDTAQEEFERQPTLSSMLLKMLKTTWRSCFISKRVLAEKQIPLFSSWKQTTGADLNYTRKKNRGKSPGFTNKFKLFSTSSMFSKATNVFKTLARKIYK